MEVSRVLARQVGRRLSAEEIASVGGGTAATTTYCGATGGGGPCGGGGYPQCDSNPDDSTCGGGYETSQPAMP